MKNRAHVFQLSLMFSSLLFLLLFQAFTIIISTTYAHFFLFVVLCFALFCRELFVVTSSKFMFSILFYFPTGQNDRRKNHNNNRRWYAFKVCACGIISSNWLAPLVYCNAFEWLFIYFLHHFNADAIFPFKS